MSLEIHNLTVKNFMSVGNNTQAVNFDRRDLTLVLGENLDLGGDDTGARNGTGKTTIINALSYGLYGQALTNIKKDNLINKTNGRNMLVTVEFSVQGRNYRIERGRRPNVTKLYIDGNEQTDYTDSSQGDSRETQHDIDRLLGMTVDMFKHVVALNTYTEPFLSMRVNDQRMIIEQLLGITILSEKADKLKEQIKSTKELINEERINIKAQQDANARIGEQIENLKKRQKLWIAKRDEDCNKLERNIRDLADIDIEIEIENQRLLSDYHDRRKKVQDAEKWIKAIQQDKVKEERNQTKLEKEISDLENHTCYACGGALHDQKHEQVLAGKLKQHRESALQLLAYESQEQEHLDIIALIGDIGAVPVVVYDTLELALNHRSTLEQTVDQFTRRSEEPDPYAEQIIDMETTALAEITWDTINTLTQVQEHQEFLLKMLTNKDSFVRKKIIDQNLAYLNSRLAAYLSAIGLPHQVQFQNDLSVEITELGRDLDFHNLSRGEMTRVILSLSLSFRDVWESLYNPINLLFIDELIDNGFDQSGVEATLSILKRMSRERNKSIWLVSHKDELAGRVDHIQKVVKENGFSNYEVSE